MKAKLLIFFIISLALVLRIIGVPYGYPYAIGHFDEVFSVRQAMSFGATKSFQPIMLSWPPLHSYIIFALYALYYLIGKLFNLFQTPADFALLYLIKPFNLYFLARLLSVIFGSLTVWLTYLIAKKIYNLKIGMWAAWLLAISINHIAYSQWAKPDVFMVFLVTTSLLFTCLIITEKRIKHYIFAGFFAGLALAAKYYSATMAISLISAHLIVSPKKNLLKSVFDKKILIYFAMLAVGFFASSPHCLLKPHFFYKEFLWGLDMLNLGELGNINQLPWLWVITGLIKYEFLAGIIFLIGIIYCIFRPKKTHWIFLTFILIFLLLAGKISKASVHYLLPIFPSLSILGAVFLAETASFISKRNKILEIVFVAIIVILTAVPVFNLERSFLSKDSRIITKDWIEQNIPAKAKIALFALRYRDLPPLVSYGGEFSSVDYGPKAQALYHDKRLIDGLNKYYSGVKTYQIYKLEKEIPEDEVNILLSNSGLPTSIYLKSCYKQGWRSMGEIKSAGIEYIILSSFLYGRYDQEPPINHPLYMLYKKDRQYFNSLMNSKELRLIKEIEPGKSFGPTIKIYKIVY